MKRGEIGGGKRKTVPLGGGTIDGKQAEVRWQGKRARLLCTPRERGSQGTPKNRRQKIFVNYFDRGGIRPDPPRGGEGGVRSDPLRLKEGSGRDPPPPEGGGGNLKD